MKPLHILLVTGMSGAGKSTALHALDDLGFYIVDNLPPRLAVAFADLCRSSPDVDRAAIGLHPRIHGISESLASVLDDLGRATDRLDLLFMDASDDALLRRFSETRRPHPIAPHGDVLIGIQGERDLLHPLRERASLIIDTTTLNTHETRRVVTEYVAKGASPSMTTRVLSFGFRHGIPVDADIVLDVRFLPNPHFVPGLRPMSGEDRAVSEYVLASDESRDFLEHAGRMLEFLLPRYEREGKAYLTIAIGCTGGRHRSVAIAETLAKRLSEVAGRSPKVIHRDIHR